MRKMKNSGIVRLGQIPEQWHVSRVKYLYSVIGSGTTPQSGNTMYYDGDKCWIQSGDLYKTKYIVDTEKKITEYAEKTISSLKCYKAEFLVIAMYGASIGNVSISKIDACVNQACCVIKPNEKVDFNYLYYSLVNGKDIMLDMSIGGTQPNISQAKILEFPILLPPYEVQKKIADFLDAKCADIDQIRADIEKQIEILTDYKKSVITEAVTKGLDPKAKLKDSGIEWIGKIPNGWKTLKVKYLATEPDSLFTDGDWINSDIITEEGVRYLTSGNVGEGYFKKQGDGYISQESFEQLHCLKALPNDLMICRLNLPIGRSCIIPNDEPFYVVAVDNVILRPNHDIDKKFIMYCMNTPGYAAEAEMAAGGTTMKRISRTDLGNLVVPIPSLEEQKAIANYLDEKCSEIDATIAEKQKQLETLEEYKKSLIFEYVTGKKEVPT